MSETSMLVCLSKISSSEKFSFGGKFVGLYDLYHAGFPLPQTWCIHERFSEMSFIPLLLDAIKEQISFPLIVRSSANHEDGNDRSCAGLFDSYICNDRSTLENALVSSLTYKPDLATEKYLNHSKISLNILIQEYIDPEISGVFVTDYSHEELAYGEYTRGHLSIILQEDLPASSFSFREEGIFGEGVLPEIYLLAPFIEKIRANWTGKYEYEWLFCDGSFFFVQKRKFNS